jgi:DNA-binding NarL/FixJ family response regulator
MNKKVIAYDDEAVLRKTLENVFVALKTDYTLIATFANATDVLAHVKMHQPDAILLDIEMRENDEDGLLALHAIKKQYPNQKVMMLTTFDNDDKIFNAICLGADGYMLKTDLIDQVPQIVLRQSLNILFADGAYLTPAVAKKILHLFRDKHIGDKIQQVVTRFTNIFNQSKNPKPNNMTYKLTKTQQLILEQIVEGKTAVQIAKDRNVSENTVCTHIKAIYQELEVHTRGEAVKKAYEAQLVKLEKEK